MRDNPKLTIQLLGWNSAGDLSTSLPALQAIPSGQAIIRYIDNHSSDNAIDIVRKLLPAAEIMLLPTNVGYTGGHNAGFAVCTTPFVLVLNPDVTVDWQGIEKVLHIFDDPNVGAVQGKLLRSDTVIDSAGIIQTLSLNGKERGAGEEDHGQYDERADIAAVTGACGLFRMQALREVAYIQNEFFDKDFFAYKEDVDLGWRLRNAGWKIRYEPVVVGYHGRAVKRTGIGGWGLQPRVIFQRLRDPKTKLSLRNYVWMIVKNASWKDLLFHELFIDIRLLVFFVFSLVYWPLLPVWANSLRGLPHMVHKRFL